MCPLATNLSIAQCSFEGYALVAYSTAINTEQRRVLAVLAGAGLRTRRASRYTKDAIATPAVALRAISASAVAILFVRDTFVSGVSLASTNGIENT